jgi:hypothetical protein
MAFSGLIDCIVSVSELSSPLVSLVCLIPALRVTRTRERRA